mgnify:CR=1 FL=1
MLISRQAMCLENERFNQSRNTEKHPYSIGKGNGKDQRWRTYIPDKTKKYGRKLIVKATEEELYEWLNDFYKEKLLDNLLDKVNLEIFLSRMVEI